MDNTKIEWCDATWNPVKGCSRVSEGCRHCYAEGLAARFHQTGQWGHGLTEGGKWTGKVTLDEKALLQPLRWKKPRRIFVNSLSDLFHPNVPDEWVDRIFAIMALCPQHTFQVLTKRPERMRDYASDQATPRRSARRVLDLAINGVVSIRRMADDGWPVESIGDPECPDDVTLKRWPLPNVWLGVSVENQKAADERIPHLLATPATVRFLSCEPLLGPVDLTSARTVIEGNTAEIDALTGDVWLPGNCGQNSQTFRADMPRIDWIICGGESGPKARPMHPQWARDLRDQCKAAGVPFFFKQWGEWAPQLGAVDGWEIDDDPEISRFDHREWDVEKQAWGEPFWPAWCDWDDLEEEHVVSRIGKRRAGRLLDGCTHDGMPLASKDAAE